LCIPSLHIRVNKIQTEGQINAELRDLAKRIRELRGELKSRSSAAQPPADAGDRLAKTTQAVDEDRKLKRLRTPRRRRA